MHAAVTPGLHSASPVELKAQIEAERAGESFLVYRDGSDRQQIVTLGEEPARFCVGRGAGADISLAWDAEVSHLHAELERIGDDWTVADDGLSRNGTFLNGDRVTGRRRLRDGDAIRFGNTAALFRAPSQVNRGTTHGAPNAMPVSISDAQRRVLVALCRPLKDRAGYTAPATNQAIAAELFVSVGVVKAHLRALCEKFDVGELPQNQKRLKLVERAFQSGALSPKDL